MSQYHTFTAHDAVAYAQQFAGIDNPSELVSAQEVGDGNLNLVLKCSIVRASAGRSSNRPCPTCAASANPGR
ncbi:5-methylthioribose kinase [Klebsiella pneumoniae subsp. pneumoniae]|uniref:5-methylthioribose kinase n=1 Tax=Klebsiella pneumoniae subsp. pneumoniae TaxID=72407 RepID=A0A378A379_KLEPN|nr:5-methylthioribose kinase [Klebsiella pneumoniae subsp. pneumoniae]